MVRHGPWNACKFQANLLSAPRPRGRHGHHASIVLRFSFNKYTHSSSFPYNFPNTRCHPCHQDAVNTWGAYPPPSVFLQ